MSARLGARVLVLALAAAAPAAATMCALDTVPAASLLFPFVVFDYNSPVSGQTTVLSITNTGAAAQVVHVVLWSDAGAPVLALNVVLSGYDSQTIDVRDVLYYGVLPSTGTAGDLVVAGGVSEAGPVDAPEDLPAPASTASLAQRCPSSSVAYPDYPPIPAVTLLLLKDMLQQSQTVTRGHEDCVDPTLYTVGDWFEGRTTADPTWMYVTADVVWTCCHLTPVEDAAIYWQDGPTNNPTFDPYGAQRMTDNVLVGDVVWVNEELRYAESSAAVHLEASRSLGDTWVGTSVRNPLSGRPQSFYHQHSVAGGTSDLREPLPTVWSVRYLHDDGGNYSTRFRVWKAPSSSPDLELPWDIYGQQQAPWVAPDLGFGDQASALDCRAYTYYSWDEDENVAAGGIEPNLLPLVTQEVPADQFALVDQEGWMLFLWPRSNTTEGDLYQTWMEVRYDAWGTYSMVTPGVAVRSFNCGDQPGGLAKGGGR